MSFSQIPTITLKISVLNWSAEVAVKDEVVKWSFGTGEAVRQVFLMPRYHVSLQRGVFIDEPRFPNSTRGESSPAETTHKEKMSRSLQLVTTVHLLYMSPQRHPGITLILYPDPEAENLSIDFIYKKFSSMACSHYNAAEESRQKARTAACFLPPYEGPPLPPWATYSLASDCTSDDPRLIFKESVEIGDDRGDLYLISYTEKVPNAYEAVVGASRGTRIRDLYTNNDAPSSQKKTDFVVAHRYQLLFHRSPKDTGILKNWFEVIPDYRGFNNYNDSKWIFHPPVDAFNSRLRDTDNDRYICRQVRAAFALFERQKDHILKNATDITFLADDGERLGIVDPNSCGMKNTCRPWIQSIDP